MFLPKVLECILLRNFIQQYCQRRTDEKFHWILEKMARPKILYYTSFVGRPTAEAYIVRKKSIFFLFAILFILLASSSYSQNQLPRIAVLPFSSINVSKSDAEAITNLFETGLVNTGVYNVIEQSQMDEILKVQEFSLSDCTSDQCAIEVGQLLSAEQIVLGSLSSVGGKFILNAKIVDVAKGVNLKADKVDTASLAEMTDGAEVLAYKLAGLTYRKEASEEMAREFGEVFVETDPTSADILMNGVNRGVSPVLITKVPLGFVRVESRKGNLYATEEVRITRSTSKLSLKLSQQLGSLYIKTSAAALQVVLDGVPVGPMGSGLVENIPVGQHKVELKGEGLYWFKDVTISLGVITQIEATPQPVGSVSYSLPPGVSATIQGKAFQQLLVGDGQLMFVWEGKYTVNTVSQIYEPYSTEILVEKGKAATFKPSLFFTEDYEYQQFRRLLEGIERQLNSIYEIAQRDIDQIADTRTQIQSAHHPQPELVAKSELLLLKANERLAIQKRNEHLTAVKKELSSLSERKAKLQGRLQKKTVLRRNFSAIGWISLSTGILSSGFGVLSYFLTEAAYKNYNQTASTSEATLHKNQVQTWDTLMLIGSGVGLAGFGTATTFFLIRPKTQKISEEILNIELKENKLQESLQ
jgi:TolB-like protein